MKTPKKLLFVGITLNFTFSGISPNHVHKEFEGEVMLPKTILSVKPMVIIM